MRGQCRAMKDHKPTAAATAPMEGTVSSGARLDWVPVTFSMLPLLVSTAAVQSFHLTSASQTSSCGHPESHAAITEAQWACAMLCCSSNGGQIIRQVQSRKDVREHAARGGRELLQAASRELARGGDSYRLPRRVSSGGPRSPGPGSVPRSGSHLACCMGLLRLICGHSASLLPLLSMHCTVLLHVSSKIHC